MDIVVGDGHHGSQKLFQNQADRATVNRDADVPAYAIVDDLEDSEDDTNNTSDMFESTVLAASPISAKESLDKEFKYVNVKDGQALGEEIILSPYVSKRPDEIVEVVDWDLEEYYVYKDSNPLEASSPSQEYPKQLYNTLEFLEGGPLDDSIEKTKMNNFIGSMDDTSSQAQESQGKGICSQKALLELLSRKNAGLKCLLLLQIPMTWRRYHRPPLLKTVCLLVVRRVRTCLIL